MEVDNKDNKDNNDNNDKKDSSSGSEPDELDDEKWKLNSKRRIPGVRGTNDADLLINNDKTKINM